MMIIHNSHLSRQTIRLCVVLIEYFGYQDCCVVFEDYKGIRYLVSRPLSKIKIEKKKKSKVCKV